MGPRRKKTKHSAQSEDNTNDQLDTAPSDNSLEHKNSQSITNPDGNTRPAGQEDNSKTDTTLQDKSSGSSNSPITPAQPGGNRASWYRTGSWAAKASPVAQATRESISVAGGATSEALAEGAKQTGRYVHNSLRRSTKSVPTISSESIIHATGSNADADKPRTPVVKSNQTEVKSKEDAQVKQVDVQDKNAAATGVSTTETVKPPEAVAAKTNSEENSTTAPKPEVDEKPSVDDTKDPPLPPDPSKDNNNAAGWFGWWSRPDGYVDVAGKTKQQDDDAQASGTPLPSSPAKTPAENPHSLPEPTEDIADPININDTFRSTRSIETAASSRSWFRLWSSTQNRQAEQEENNTPSKDTPPTDSPVVEQAQESDDSKTNDPKPNDPKSSDSKPDEAKLDESNNEDDGTPHAKSAGWAFWSRDRGKDDAPTPNGTQRRVGELAVADTPSQSHPEAAQFNEEPQRAKSVTKIPRSTSLTSNASLSSSSSQTRMSVSEASKPLDPAKVNLDLKASKPQPQPYPNLVVPTFGETFSPAYIPSYWERAATYLASSLRLIDVPGQASHVSIAPTTPKIKSAIAIGVHGYFPTPLIQRVLGQPTGTSIRFANHASAAIRDWVDTHQPGTACEIETVALEGEGFIADRVVTLWKLLLNWLSHLRQADLILVACHSQGVPVAIMLVNKLINLGCLSPNVKVGVCAMAGVNLGPFADYKSRLLGAGAAAELFEFSRPGSRVSLEYAAALEGVLRHNVRVTYCGSIDDQLVSLESSLFTTMSHPHVYRAVFVDGRLHAPNFLTHLVAFALKLRNLGVSDHGLIRELSLPLAGSLYGGEGHSRIYDESSVYDLALHFTLETTEVLPSAMSPTPASEATERRSSRGGPGGSVSAANALRRGSISSTTLPGIGPTMLPYEVPASGSNANPYFLPWALRGILEEEIVKRDMSDEVQTLIKLYEEWRPQSKVLKDVKFRLEGVRSKL